MSGTWHTLVFAVLLLLLLLLLDKLFFIVDIAKHYR